jgi:hypothetical protein
MDSARISGCGKSPLPRRVDFRIARRARGDTPHGEASAFADRRGGVRHHRESTRRALLRDDEARI